MADCRLEIDSRGVGSLTLDRPQQHNAFDDDLITDLIDKLDQLATDSAVRITHLPTGITVSQQDEKSQHKNRAKAMQVLRARLFEAERARADSERAADRKSQVGSGDRSERIRTYNFPQGRVTDHRINLTLHKLEKILAGDGLDEMVDALIREDQTQRLAAVDETA